MNCPDSYNDDQQGYYLDQAEEILALGLAEMLTNDHKEALKKEQEDELC